MIDDVVEYHLYATQRMGEISAGIEKAKPGKVPFELLPGSGSNSKTIILAEAGINIHRANEAEYSLTTESGGSSPSLKIFFICFLVCFR